MNAITTKYIGATDFKGSRIKATAGNGQTVTISYPHEYNSEDAHAQAAIALCIKMNWLPTDRFEDNQWEHDALVGGGTKDGYAFVFACKPENRIDVYRLPVGDGKPAK